ncbi:Rv3235 family protein [Kocuria sp.]|uniref:Rv3235 family protein n=1 Tax=Kocuria sp. TaxID=1871328 RepID=UPI0026DF9C2E|nr:Rv3235 family protein [Kocuria sp.]MDO5619584.1 Rv3235 family protein [Kocuria sp.]
MSIIARSETAPPAPSGYRWRNQQTTEPATFTPGDERERITALSRSLTVAALEVLDGNRPAHQLARWTTYDIVEKLRRRAELIQRRRSMEPAAATVQAIHRHSEVLRQRVCQVADGIYEVALVVQDESRVRAVVLRVERPERAWRITVLEIG